MNSEIIREKNSLFFRLLSDYLNLYPDAVTAELVKETEKSCNMSTEEAFRLIFAGMMDVYSDRELRRGWISRTFSLLDPEVYENDPYRKTVKLPAVTDGEWEFYEGRYKPYEAFVYNDPVRYPDGSVIPKIGFFEREYTYPAVRQGGREWMLITPNEIETMKKPIEMAFGDVATYGLGLGYFAFMASEKENVSSVTVVERDESVIRLFETHILPQLPHKDKIRIVNGDALAYAKGASRHDFVFADIWHDPSDGCDLYLGLKALEKEGVQYAYWIEDTLKLYL